MNNSEFLYRNQSMDKNTAPLQGGLIINKEAGMTSFDVIRALRARFPGVKWGHSGTLDPFATGVLLILLGNATRLQDELHLLPKTYRATITLGATSDTDDATGVITARHPGLRAGIQTSATWIPGQARNDSILPTLEHILAALKAIKTQTTQIPPDYAAIKIQGQKMYDLAREGKTIVKKPRSITIHDIKLEKYEYPNLTILVKCSTGTYIRSIARDIGEILDTGAYCSALTRTAIGPYKVENAYSVQDALKDIQTALIPIEDLVLHIPSQTYSDINVAKLKNGREVESEENTPINTAIALLDKHAKLIGIGVREGQNAFIKPKKIFLS